MLDASQLEVFEPCPRKWEYGYPKNLIPKRSHRAFDTGSYYHAVLDCFYGLPIRPENPITDFVERLRFTCDFSAKDELLRKYNITDSEEQIFHRKRLVEYFYFWNAEDELMTSIAVEQGFSWLLYEDEKRRYILEGKIDLVNECKPYGLNVMDHKTQSRKDDRWEFNHQVCNYLSYMEQMGTPADYFVYNYIGLQDKLPKDGFRRMVYQPHPGMLKQWKSEVLRTFDEMYNYLEYKEMNPDYELRRRRSACDSSKYGLCTYHKLCSVPDDRPDLKLVVLSHYKEKDEKWRAWT